MSIFAWPLGSRSGRERVVLFLLVTLASLLSLGHPRQVESQIQQAQQQHLIAEQRVVLSKQRDELWQQALALEKENKLSAAIDLVKPAFEIQNRSIR